MKTKNKIHIDSRNWSQADNLKKLPDVYKCLRWISTAGLGKSPTVRRAVMLICGVPESESKTPSSSSGLTETGIIANLLGNWGPLSKNNLPEV
jgi:hypothetical protein